MLLWSSLWSDSGWQDKLNYVGAILNNIHERSLNNEQRETKYFTKNPFQFICNCVKVWSDIYDYDTLNL